MCRSFAVYLLLIILSPYPALGAELIGKTVGVHDGDTITVLISEKTQAKIRLTEIDAPELKQPYGMSAKKALSDLVFDQEVKVSWKQKDRYGRIVGKVYVSDGAFINAEMIRTGSAWVYRQYSRDKDLMALEDEARKNKIGLWALQADQITPPWEWRHSGEQPRNVLAAPLKGAAFSCDGKMYCKQMISCAEARFYQKHCGLSRLDGDHNGMPCESLCR